MIAKLKDGFEVQLSEDTLNSWEFLELLSDIDEGEYGLIVKAARLLLGKEGVKDEGEYGLIVKAARLLLGKEGVKALKEHIRTEDGKVPADTMVNAISELMESANESKN